MAKFLPPHLKKYIVEQESGKYTPVDQACWRFVLRQLKNFLQKHAHENYLEGLEQTGIEIERIPKIEDISKKLEKFGWRALPVSGFIPPAAFMELQSLGVLPIASDMRTLEHLSYTPAPDIVHEAAGHAPMLIQPEFANYLREYAQVARKAIISKEDLNMYEAIRNLSDIKESSHSSAADIDLAQKSLEQANDQISHISEAAELGRMNWWTAEYGLIGPLDKPKIFGAGLLSSVGESRWCLSEKVKKIPLTIDCVKQSYDITEPQPQLFVTPDFATLTKVLHQFAGQMAFRQGGLCSVKKAVQSQSVNTVELNSGIQISGVCSEYLTGPNEMALSYLKFVGPTQLCFQDQEIPGQGRKAHHQGFGTAVGFLKTHPNKCLSTFSESDLSAIGIGKNKEIQLEFTSGIQVKGVLKDFLFKNGKLILMSFDPCRVSLGAQILFEPSWGTYDMAVGSLVTSVFGGPADRSQYGEVIDFITAKVPRLPFTVEQLELHKNYQKLRDLRESEVSGPQLESEIQILIESHLQKFPQDWLLPLEIIELAQNRISSSNLTLKLERHLLDIAERNPDKKSVIEDGLSLSNQL